MAVPGPASRARPPLKVGALPLPEGAKAKLPAHDGEPLFISYRARPSAGVSGKEVLDTVVAPVARALGLPGGEKSLRPPPDRGIPQPAGNPRGLAQAMAAQYATRPTLARRRTREVLDAFLGKARPAKALQRTIRAAEGMTLDQLVADLGKQEIQYPFIQEHEGVPIEHTALVASRRQGQGIHSLSGSVISQYAIGNQRLLAPEDAAGRAAAEISKLPGVERGSGQPLARPFLVLLPYTTRPDDKTDLRYAYRLQVSLKYDGATGSAAVWIDAQDGKIDQLVSFLAPATQAQGAAFNRDPGLGTTTLSFQVDPSSGGTYQLQLSGFSNRVDYQGDHDAGFNSGDVSINDTGNGSSAAVANFDQPPLNDASQALCSTGTNKSFLQVGFFATLQRDYNLVVAQGISPPFPATPFSPILDSARRDAVSCGAWNNLEFAACHGYYDPSCPNYTDGSTGKVNLLNPAHDATWIGHELGHNVTQALTNGRPDDWCGVLPCSMPVGWSVDFHDLADAWSAHFENTNCWSGWTAKNVNGVNGALNCQTSSEAGFWPRLHQVTTPFNPAAVGDHFPEHRTIGGIGQYSDMQMAAAALWEVRGGMLSKSRLTGSIQYGVRLQHALTQTGFMGFTPGLSDQDRFRSLHDLEVQLTSQWANSGLPGPDSEGPATTNKVTAGFARAGVFLIPYQCLDADPATADGLACPNGSGGADAVVDVDDDDPSDDLVEPGRATLPEVDSLKKGGKGPIFHVWTGPRYRLDQDTETGVMASFSNPSPCNEEYQVEVANNASFTGAIASSWRKVDRNPANSSPECYDAWSPSSRQWKTLQDGGDRVYYRVRTRDESGGNERLSTSPGAGLWTVPPPYAVITADGRPEY